MKNKSQIQFETNLMIALFVTMVCFSVKSLLKSQSIFQFVHEDHQSQNLQKSKMKINSSTFNLIPTTTSRFI